MNGAHIHLLLNHIPVIGTGFGFLVLLVALLRKSTEIRQVSLGIFIISAIVAIPVFFSGEPAEEIAEHLPGVTHALIEEHEEAGKIAFVAIEILGIIALATLVFPRRLANFQHGVSIALLVLSVVVGGLMLRTAGLGGEIRHTEIRSDAKSATIGEIDAHDSKKERSDSDEDDD